MSKPDPRWIHSALEDLATNMRYPETPDLTESAPVAPRQPVLSGPLAIAAALVLAVSLTLTIPPVRSAVLEWVQAGAVTLFRLIGWEALEPDQSYPLADPLLKEMARLTTLEEAAAQVPFPLLLPEWPPELGQPDEVWLHGSAAEPTVITIWRERDGQPPLALFQIATDRFISKGVREYQVTQVGGQEAIWAKGPHLMRLPDGGWRTWALIEDHVLIWWSDPGPTYRLETRGSLEDARRIAESLHGIE